MKHTVMNFARGCAAAAVLLGGATVSEASPISLVTLVNGTSSVELCLDVSHVSCGAFGLSNWIANGTSVSGFQQWFTGSIVNDGGIPPGIGWSGSLDTLSAPTYTPLTPSSGKASYFDALQNVGITIDYLLADIGGVSHILETATVNNPTYYFLFASLSDGMQVNTGPVYGSSYSNFTLATADYTPNPEPMTMVLLGTGLVAVGRSRWRKASMA